MNTSSFSIANGLALTSTETNINKIRLFCFPYAGGGASVFRTWPQFLSPKIEVCTVQLPGREERLNERPYTNIQQAIQQLSSEIQPYLEQSFAFFGHSMGALIAFELARHLRRHKHKQPIHLFLSGYGASHAGSTISKRLHLLSDSELIDQLFFLKGSPEAILKEPEIMNLILPTIRCDFTLTETYQFYIEDPLNTPITALCGIDDQLCTEQMLDWHKQTSEKFSFYEISGDHFFIHESRLRVLSLIKDTLSEYTKIPESFRKNYISSNE